MRTPSRSSIQTWWCLALICAGSLAGCAPAHLPVLGAGPFTAADRLELVDAVRTAQSAGYHPVEIDPVRGRFVVQARRYLSTEVRFVVRLTTELVVVIVPEGSVVELVDGRFHMPRVLASEYAEFAQAMETGLVTRIGLR